MKFTLAAALALLVPAQEFPRGKILDGTAKSGVTWHVRVPAKHDSKRPMPAILILHGSNMNSKAYVHTLAQAWPKLAEDYILIGVNGENRVKGSPDDDPAFNYTYVNFMGKSKYKGYPGTDRESPALVSEAVQELKTKLAISKVLVGGHSQGGFLSYNLYMNYPDLFAGAFPVSCGLLMQCEPAAFDKPELRAQQRKGAIAIVHAENDPVVEFSMGKSAHESFEDDAFPAVRLFADKEAAHMFALLPVEPAVRWLEAMTAETPEAMLEFAQKQLAAREWRDAGAALLRARDLDAKKKYGAKIKSLQQAIEKEAGAKVKEVEKLIKASKDDSWVADFVKFRSQFESSDAAKGVLEFHRKLREQHEKPAEELFFGARQDFQSQRRDEGYKKYEEIVKKYFASSWYRYAKGALDRRK